jgi:CRISPR-associated protein Csm3
MDALGGNGSRGYGRIEFEFDDNDFREHFGALNPFGG